MSEVQFSISLDSPAKAWAAVEFLKRRGIKASYWGDFAPTRAKEVVVPASRIGEAETLIKEYIQNRHGGIMKHRSRRNPMDLATSWTGSKAGYISPPGRYGAMQYSELAMHTGGAGKHVVRFALWRRPRKGYGPKAPLDMVNWAQVELSDGRVIDGTPSEVLPGEVRNIIGYQTARMPNRKVKLQLWALSRGVAVNRKNPLTKKESAGLARSAHFWGKSGIKAKREGFDPQYHAGRSDGLSEAIARYGPRKAKRLVRKLQKRAATVWYNQFAAAGSMVPGQIDASGWHKSASSARKHASAMRSQGYKAGVASLKNKKSVRRNIPETHPIWKASSAVHKFMSYLDNLHLGLWRDVPLAAIYHGGSAAKRAYTASVLTVQGRMRELASRLLEIGYMRSRKSLMKTPLRAIAGSFGLMEELRSDF